MLEEVLESIDVREGDLNKELAIMMRNQKMNQDELEFVGFIRNAIGYREDIRKIEVNNIINNYLIGLD
jgi:hypothetical protein